MKRPLFALLALSLALPGCKTAEGDTPVEKRDYTDQMSRDVLDKLYELRPSAKGHIEGAAGYGVFCNIGTKIFVLASGNGYGVIVDNDTKKRTYMRMAEVGFGVGMGVKDFRAVFVFDNEAVMNQFMNDGWDFGGDADAAAKSGESGVSAEAALSVAPGISLYQLTENGLALSATVAGTKYWKDADLNKM